MKPAQIVSGTGLGLLILLAIPACQEGRAQDRLENAPVRQIAEKPIPDGRTIETRFSPPPG